MRLSWHRCALTRLSLFGVEFADFRALVDSKFLIG
jgi:hypothetical protein